MSVKIRLTRTGTTKRPFYRIVATDSRKAGNGRVIEFLGTYDPQNFQLPKDSAERNPTGLVNMKTDRIQYWLSVGAQPSDTMASILRRLKIQIKRAA